MKGVSGSAGGSVAGGCKFGRRMRWATPDVGHIFLAPPCPSLPPPPPAGATVHSLLTVPQTKKRRREDSQAAGAAQQAAGEEPPPAPLAAANGAANGAAAAAAAAAAEGEGDGEAGRPAGAKRMKLGAADDVSTRVAPQLPAAVPAAAAAAAEQPSTADPAGEVTAAAAAAAGGEGAADAGRRCWPLPPEHYVLTLEQLQVGRVSTRPALLSGSRHVAGRPDAPLRPGDLEAHRLMGLPPDVAATPPPSPAAITPPAGARLPAAPP